MAYAEKVKTALAQIKAPYVIVLLDDYLLTRAIDNSVINEIVLEAISHKADYVRFDKFRGERKVKDAKYLNSIKSLGNRPYQVNMEPSLWKTPTLIELLDGQQTAWALEVSLTENAKKHNLRCFSASGKYLPYLDTIRKGKILHKAYKTLQKSPYYKGKREKCPLKCEARLFFISIAKAVTPFSLQKAIKRQLVRRGHRYYSNWEQN